jgi:hypothetical protein
MLPSYCRASPANEGAEWRGSVAQSIVMAQEPHIYGIKVLRLLRLPALTSGAKSKTIAVLGLRVAFSLSLYVFILHRHLFPA